MNEFIVFEGIDGAGKTTLAKRLARDIDAAYIKTPGEGFSSAREYVDNGTPPDTKLLFYLASVHDASAKIERTLMERSVVCDRYIWSSLIPHSVYFNREFTQLERRVQPLLSNLSLPHRTILVTVDEDEQLRRLTEERNPLKPTASDSFCFDTDKRRKVKSLYERIAEREDWFVIDTTHKSADDALKELQGELYHVV